MAAGDFSPSALATINVKASQIWADSAINKEFIAQAKALQFLKEEQTAEIVPLEDSEKDNTVKVQWVTTPDFAPEDATTECTIGGTKAESKAKTYTLGTPKMVEFAVDEKVMRSSIFSREEVVARQMMKAKKSLDEFLAKAVLSGIDSFAGDNVMSSESKYKVFNGDTYVNDADMNANMFSYLLRLKERNKLADPFFLSGQQLFDPFYNAQKAFNNADGKAELNKFNDIRMKFDLSNFSLQSLDHKLFLIDKGAAAFFDKVYYSERPIEYKGSVGQTRYSVESDNIPGLRYDVIYTMSCTGNEITHKWRLTANYLVAQNPYNGTNTGILSIINSNTAKDTNAIPTYADLTAGNAALAAGVVFWNTALGRADIATA